MKDLRFSVDVPDGEELDEEGIALTIATLLREDYDLDHSGVAWDYAPAHPPRQVPLEPTNAMLAGEAVVDQCSWCGTLVEHEVQIPLGACPACGDTKWWRQSLPVGPFTKEKVDG